MKNSEVKNYAEDALPTKARDTLHLEKPTWLAFPDWHFHKSALGWLCGSLLSPRDGHPTQLYSQSLAFLVELAGATEVVIFTQQNLEELH